MRVIACRTPYGKGGLGQHFAQLVEESREKGELAGYFANSLKPGDEDIARLTPPIRLRRTKRFTPLRYSPGWVAWLGEYLFDTRIAKMLDFEAEAFMGFVGKSLHTFRKARSLGYKRLELIAANSHVRNVQRMHAIAAKDFGHKDTWLNDALANKTIKEYEQADFVYTHSEYTRQSLIDGGVDEAKLVRSFLTVHPRFQPPVSRPDDGVFRVVYTGRIDATKGIPLLIEAFNRLPSKNVELTLVGGCSHKTMKRWLTKHMSKNSNIKLAPGDPLKPLQMADVYVHPTYEDGFAYAPMEALACGAPVIVTEDTGMKEHVEEGVNGYVVPTGNWEVLLERMEHLMSHPLTRLESALLETTYPGKEPMVS